MFTVHPAHDRHLLQVNHITAEAALLRVWRTSLASVTLPRQEELYCHLTANRGHSLNNQPSRATDSAFIANISFHLPFFVF